MTQIDFAPDAFNAKMKPMQLALPPVGIHACSMRGYASAIKNEMLPHGI